MDESSGFGTGFGAQIDPNFEPQSRPRSCTWPMKRPNISGRKNALQDEEETSMILETTVEEPGFAEPLLDNVMNFGIKQEERDDALYPNFQFMDCGGDGILDTSFGLDQFTDYGSMLMSPSQPSSATSETQKLSFTKLETIPQDSTFPSCNFESKPRTSSQESLETVEYKNVQASNEPQKKIPTAGSATSATATKPKTSSRKNAWGNLSYADLITQAIESTADKRLTLAQIYDWMVKNIDYFKDKGDSNSSAGWKNSIRHNLSLHSKFKRVQNEGTGKSSWWVINYEAKPNKPSRRRTSSLEASNSKLKHARARAVSKKNELKKQKSCPKKDQANWVRSPNSSAEGMVDFDASLNQAYNIADFRHRTSSNASSIGRMSPQRPVLTQDLEAEGAPPLSPLSSSYNPGNNFEFLGRSDNSFSLVDTADHHAKVLEGIENMDILKPASPMTQPSANDGTNIYLNTTPPSLQQVSNVTNPNSNLNNLLQQGRPGHAGSAPKLNFVIGDGPQNKHLSNIDISSAVPRQRANTMPKLQKLQPQPKYIMSDRHRKKSGDVVTQHTTGVLFSSNNLAAQQGSSQNSFTQYQFCQVQNPHQIQQPQLQQVNQTMSNSQPMQQRQAIPQPQEVYMQQQQQPENFYPVQQQQQIDTGINNQQPQLVPTQPQTNIEFPESKYPTDLSSLDNSDIFDPGSVDLDQIFEDITRPDVTGIDFSSYFPQENAGIMDVVKVEVTTQPPPYQYSSNPVLVSLNQPINVQQQQQQQVFIQENSVRNPPVMTVLSTPPNGTVFNCGANGSVVMRDGPVCNGDVRFVQPHEIAKDQSSNWSR